jgi:Tfp pilus assembly protein PilF
LNDSNSTFFSPSLTMSGAKAALKAAKEQMTSGDFKSALKSCNKAINADRDNYLAIVMAGKCQDNIGDKLAAEKVGRGTFG